MRLFQLRINDISPNNRLHLCLPQQSVQISVCIIIIGFQNLLDYRIGRSLHPIRHSLAIITKVIDYRPGIKNLRVAKFIVVIPGLKLRQFIRLLIISSHLLYLAGRKAKELTELFIQHRKNSNIIKSAKNTFLSNTQNTSHYNLSGVRIILQSRREEAPDKLYSIIIIAINKALLNRRIVFINDNNRSLLMMLMQHSAKCLQAEDIFHIASLIFDNTII